MSATLRSLAPLEAQAGAALGAAIRLAAVHGRGADALDASARLRDRRRGRAALERLLGRLGRDEPAAALRFPHPELSLSHSGDWAIAAGCAAARGIGIDLEFARPMDPRAARFFLAGRELAYIDALPRAGQGAELLRLWTVKEASFKACADNAGRLLADFEMDQPGALAGTARRIDGAAFTVRYVSIDLGAGWLAVALAATDAPATDAPATDSPARAAPTTGTPA